MTKEIVRKPGKSPTAAPEERSMDRSSGAMENNEVHVGLPPDPGQFMQARAHYENLEAAAPGVRDPRFNGLRGEDRIAEAITVADLGNAGFDLGMSGGQTLGDVYERLQTGADGITGMEDNPEVKPAEPVSRDREWYDGHNLHVLREIGAFYGQPILVDFIIVGDNDEEFNASFTRTVDSELVSRLYKEVATSSETEHSGVVAERLFRSWRVLGGSFDLDSVGAVVRIKARPGARFFGVVFAAALGGVFALLMAYAALMFLAPSLPPLTN